ncbi:MAG TPA: hypothetical protein V6C72_04980 [Chroococcales cyanobacterium]
MKVFDNVKYKLLTGLEDVDPETRDCLLVGQGRIMNATDIRRLLKRIAEQPDDCHSRWILAGVRGLIEPKNDEQLEQLISNLIWLVKQYPESKAHEQVILANPHLKLEKLKRAWMCEMRRCEGSATVAANAGHTFGIIDNSFAERCYKKAVAISPTNADLWQRLSHVYALHAIGSTDHFGIRYARKSVEALITAIKCQGSRPDGYVGHYREILLRDAARLAVSYDFIKQMKVLGQLLIQTGRVRKPEQKTAMRSHGTQDIGNAILGLAALKQSQTIAAARYLERIDGSVTSDEFVLLLANGLVRKRAFSAVIHYIEMCLDAMQYSPGSNQGHCARLTDWQERLASNRSVKLKPW